MVERTHTPAGDPLARTVETPLPPSDFRRISWGAVFAGAVIAIAVHFLLSLLGVGIGLSTVDPGATPEAETLGIGAGIWWVISSIIALIIGGYVAARLEGLPSRGDGVIHGLLTWAVMLLAMVWLMASAAGGIIGGAFNIAGDTVSAAGRGIVQAVPEVAQATGLTPDELERQADRLLQQGSMQGTDAVPSDPREARRELVIALTTMATNSGEEAATARERVITIVSQQAQISRAEATQRVARLEGELRETAREVEQTASSAAQGAADTASSASIWGFVALLLGAAAGAIGGAVGTRRSIPVVATRTA